MIPIGYIAKRISRPPGWLGAPGVVDVYSVGDCVNDNFADYIPHWKHNAHWFFDSPEDIRSLAAQISVSLEQSSLFYYQAYEMEFDGESWRTYMSEPAPSANVLPPAKKQIEGFDVVTFHVRTSPEHSPLSCNSLARDIPTNAHCLLNSFAEAKAYLENGAFREGEPGPYRIYSVFSVEWP